MASRHRLPMARPPPPGGGDVPWSRLSARLAFAWLIIWAILLAAATPRAGAPAWIWVHVAFGGFGFAGHLVLGMGFRLDATFNGRSLAPLWLQRAAPVWLSATTVALGVVVHPWSPARGQAPFVATGMFAVATGFVAFAAARQAASAPRAAPSYAGDWASRFLASVVVVYAVLAGALSLRLGILHAAVIHLWLVGFVTTAVFAVSHRILPRFSTMTPRPRLHLAQAVLAAPGPALLAWGVARPDHVWAAAGAGVEFLAAALYATLVGLSWKDRRGPQPTLPLMFLGALFLLNGMLVGIMVLVQGDLRPYLPLHVINNLVGFVTITILGAGSAMLGTAVRPVPGSVHRNVWTLAAALAVPLVLWELLFVLGGPGQAILLVTVAAMAVHGAMGLRALKGRT